MKPFTLALGFAVALVSLNVAGQAQEYPARSKIIKIVVPYPAGGPTDFVGRTVADALGKSLHKTVIVPFDRAGDDPQAFCNANTLAELRQLENKQT